CSPPVLNSSPAPDSLVEPFLILVEDSRNCLPPAFSCSPGDGFERSPDVTRACFTPCAVPCAPACTPALKIAHCSGVSCCCAHIAFACLDTPPATLSAAGATPSTKSPTPRV